LLPINLLLGADTMVGRVLLALGGTLLLVTSLSCATDPETQNANEAKTTACSYFRTFSTPTADDLAKWGMGDFHTFGLNAWFFPIWCYGTTPEGQSVKLERELTMTVARKAPGQPWQVQGYTFQKDQPLSLWYQSAAWFLAAYGVPLVIFFLLAQLFSFQDELSLLLALLTFVLFLLGAVAWSGVAGYFFFDSVLAVVFCVAAFITMTALLITFIVKSRWGGLAVMVLYFLSFFAG
jgi:hypothetical protein